MSIGAGKSKPSPRHHLRNVYNLAANEITVTEMKVWVMLMQERVWNNANDKCGNGEHTCCWRWRENGRCTQGARLPRGIWHNGSRVYWPSLAPLGPVGRCLCWFFTASVHWMWMCIHVYVGAGVWCACGGQRSTPSAPSTLFYETGSLSLSGLETLSRERWLASKP